MENKKSPKTGNYFSVIFPLNIENVQPSMVFVIQTTLCKFTYTFVEYVNIPTETRTNCPYERSQGRRTNFPHHTETKLFLCSFTLF